MEIIKQLIDFFGVNAEIVTFVDFCKWFVMLLMAVILVVTVIKALFTATWKLERSLR